MGPRSLTKILLSSKPGKKLVEDLHLKGAKKKNFNYKFSNVKALRRSMTYSQEETCLKLTVKLSKAEGNFKAV